MLGIASVVSNANVKTIFSMFYARDWYITIIIALLLFAAFFSFVSFC